MFKRSTIAPFVEGSERTRKLSFAVTIAGSGIGVGSGGGGAGGGVGKSAGRGVSRATVATRVRVGVSVGEDGMSDETRSAVRHARRTNRVAVKKIVLSWFVVHLGFVPHARIHESA